MPALVDIRRRIRSVKNTQQRVIRECGALRFALGFEPARRSRVNRPRRGAGDASLRAPNARPSLLASAAEPRA
jgi:hypothetical protein